MAIELPGFVDGSRLAGADLSAKQYTFVKVDSDGDVVACGDGELAYGILQNAPEQGDVASVMVIGISPIKLGANQTNAGISISSDTNGEAVATADTKYCTGILLEAGSEDEYRSMLICPVGQYDAPA